MDSFTSTKLVDISNKLINGNKQTQFQAIGKLYALIGEYSKNEAEKKKLLNKLFETLKSIKSKNCCQSILKMLIKCCQEGLFDYAHLISTFVLMINSKTPNNVYCLESLTELMLLFKEESFNKYALTIRNPSHPYIEILRNSNESTDNLHDLVLDQIHFIFKQTEMPLIATLLLKPVFIHIFLEESNMKHELASFLIKYVGHVDKESNRLIVQLIELYLSSLRANEYKSFMLLKSLNDIINLYETIEDIDECIDLHLILNMLIRIDQVENYDCSEHFNLMKNFISQGKKRFLTEIYKMTNLETLAENLDKICLKNLNSYLNLILQIVVDYQGSSPVEIGLFLPNLLLLNVCFGSLESVDSFKPHLLMAKKVVTNIELQLDKINLVDLESVDLFNIIEYEDQTNVEEKLNRRKLNRLFTAFILDENDVQLAKKFVDLFRQLILKWPSLYSMIFSLFIYKLRLSRNYEILSVLINSMVDLVTPKTDLSLCLNVLKSLMLTASMKSETKWMKFACMRQLIRLCTMKYDYLAYGHLSKELVSVSAPDEGKYRLEQLYTQAYCIRELILYRPDYYAQELLATISNLLNYSSRPNDQGVSALLIDCLAFLCESEVVDMVSTWNALLPQFKNETRLLTLNAYCRFMSVAAKLDHLNEPQNEKNFHQKMIENLWSLCKPGNRNQHVSFSAALSELSKFNKTYFKCSYLPAEIQQKLKEKNKKLFDLEENKEKTIDDIFPKIPAVCYVDFFNTISAEAYEGLGDLFRSMLIEELDSIPRRSISFAREKVYSQDEQEEAHRNFYTLIRSYLSEDFKSIELAELSTILYSYDVNVDRNADGKIPKKFVKSYWNSYEKAYRLIVNKQKLATVKLNQSNLDFYRTGFLRLIKNVFSSCVQALNLEYQHDLDEKLSQDERNKIEEKIRNSSCMARDRLMEMLIESFGERQGVELIDEYLLVMSAIAQTTCDYVEAEKLNAAHSAVENQRKWLETLVDFQLNIAQNKTATMAEYLKSFSYGKTHSAESLKFFYELFKNTSSSTLQDYFLAVNLRNCRAFGVSTYLIEYIHNNSKRIVEKSMFKGNFHFNTIAVYVKSLLDMDREFDMETNANLNKLMASLVDIYVQPKTDHSGDNDNYVKMLLECMFCIYDDESIYYDDANLLERLFEYLNEQFFSSKESTDSETGSFVYLACIAYKSNLIDNEKVCLIYERLKSQPKYNSLVAFFCRYLLNYGFYESSNWIQHLNTKWSKYYTDFKLNLETDTVELEACINGLLVLFSAVSIQTSSFDQNLTIPVELENSLKPEACLKDLIKFYKTRKGEHTLDESGFKKSLSFMHYKASETKYSEIYTSQTTYDYLDNFSLLRVVVNELLRLSKMTQIASDVYSRTEKQFKFLIDILLESCKSSKVRSLPPINWLNLINSMIKSKFGIDNEVPLIELTLMQVTHLNSAFSLVKNYVIDTNYFTHLQTESKRIMFKNLNNLFDRLNDQLSGRFFNKLKHFLKQQQQKTGDDSRTVYLSCMLDSLIGYFSRTGETTTSVNVHDQIVAFFVFIVENFEFSIDNNGETECVDKIVQILIKLSENENILMRTIDIPEDMLPVESRFLVNFYLRSKLISRGQMPIQLLNDPIDCLFKYIDLINVDTRHSITNLFTDCLIEISLKDFKITQDTSKIGSLKSSTLNWLLEFMGMIKSLSQSSNLKPESIELVLVLFGSFLYVMANQSMDLYDNYAKSNVKPELILNNFDSLLIRFASNPFWKQLNVKLLEWLMFIYNSHVLSHNLKSILKKSLFDLFVMLKNDQIWLKFANFINKTL